MNTQTLTTGFALSASLLFATSVMAVNASPDSGLGGDRNGQIIAQPDSSLGGNGERVIAHPDSSLGGAGQIRFDPNRQNDLASNRNGAIVRFMTAFAGTTGPWALRLFDF